MKRPKFCTPESKYCRYEIVSFPFFSIYKGLTITYLAVAYKSQDQHPVFKVFFSRRIVDVLLARFITEEIPTLHAEASKDPSGLAAKQNISYPWPYLCKTKQKKGKSETINKISPSSTLARAAATGSRKTRKTIKFCVLLRTLRCQFFFV